VIKVPAETTSQTAMPQLKPGLPVFRIVLLYAVLAAGCIALSDCLVGLVWPDVQKFAATQAAKGVAFVVISSFILLVLLRRFVQALASRDAALSAATEQARDPIWIIDETGHCAYANASACAMLAYNAQEMRECLMTNLVCDIQRREYEATVVQLRQHALAQREWRLVRKDGRKISMQLTIHRLADARHL
jgi:PAS domain S-box-containing protein